MDEVIEVMENKYVLMAKESLVKGAVYGVVTVAASFATNWIITKTQEKIANRKQVI